MSETKIYTGIADAHGLESFVECSGEAGTGSPYRFLRASLNRQRHALVYWVELNDEQYAQVADILGDMDNDERFMDACRLLHDPDFVEGGLLVVEQEMLRSWEMLPNHDLDPYWGGA